MKLKLKRKITEKHPWKKKESTPPSFLIQKFLTGFFSKLKISLNRYIHPLLKMTQNIGGIFSDPE